MWNLSAKPMILSLQDFANKQRTTFSLDNTFFQNSNFLTGSMIEAGRQESIDTAMV